MLGTFGIMFATQWLYSLVTWGTVAVLYVYLGYAIPGASPGMLTSRRLSPGVNPFSPE